MVPVEEAVGEALQRSGFPGEVLPWSGLKDIRAQSVVAYSGGGAKVGAELKLVRRALEWDSVRGFIIDLPWGDESGPRCLWKNLVPGRGWTVHKALLNAGNHGGAQRRWGLVLPGWRQEKKRPPRRNLTTLSK